MEEKIINDMPRGAITNRLKITSGKWKKIKVSKGARERERADVSATVSASFRLIAY